MKVLIIENDGNIVKARAEIVILLQSPNIFPAVRVFPDRAKVSDWYDLHNVILREKENENRTPELIPVKCIRCNYDNEPTNKFCIKCGSKI